MMLHGVDEADFSLFGKETFDASCVFGEALLIPACGQRCRKLSSKIGVDLP
jgi:hypothetical protein